MLLIKILIAGLAGITGCMISGLNSFILFGAVSILEIILRHMGVDTYLLKNYVLDIFMTPCVMFNAACAAAGYAAISDKMKPWDIQTGMLKLKDPKIFLVGAGAGIFGFLIMAGLNAVNFPIDSGAFSIVIAAVLYRLIFPKKRWINKSFRHILRGFWWLLKELVIAAIVSILTCCIYKATQETILCFAISALTLQLQKHTKLIPTTHHISICASYAAAASGFFLPAVIAGVSAHLLFVLFSGFFNMDCGTHIDGPSVAISAVSFVLFI